MEVKKIYHLGTCSTCKRILKGLNLKGVELQDIKAEQISEADLEHMAKLSGTYESLFSRRAQKYKLLDLGSKDLTEMDIKKYILEEYTFLKRPIGIVGDKIFIGNSKLSVDALSKALN